MIDKEIKVRKIINDFENRKLDEQTTIDQIRKLTGQTIDIGYLAEYWASESLDVFVSKLLIEHIHDWQSIDDNRAIALIEEIAKNLDNDMISLRNSMALERRYGKSSGTVIELIDHQDTQNSMSILEELKKETRIFL